jgi:hypothetical protein
MQQLGVVFRIIVILLNPSPEKQSNNKFNQYQYGNAQKKSHYFSFYFLDEY